MYFYEKIDMLYKIIIIPLFLLTYSIAFSQEVLNVGNMLCPIEGSAKRKNDQELNRLKNRYDFPRPSDVDMRFNWKELGKFEDDRDLFDQKKAAILRGYVLSVKMSAKETCNCNSTDPDFKDTHIVLTPSKNEKGILNQIVVEVTPRMRLLMKQKGVDWSQPALKKLVGQTIEVQGWLFYDFKHGDQSAKVMKKTNDVTRSTSWEIHPVTRITIVR